MKDCAIVTGASSGIGKSLALALARVGYNILVVARREKELKKLVETIRSMGREAIYRLVDLSDKTQREKFCKYVSTHIEPRVLVNNAGFGIHGELHDAKLDILQDMVETNIKAPMELSYLILPLLEESTSTAPHNSQLPSCCHIINIASVGGFQPGAYYTVYYASKAFVLSFSQGLHEEFRRAKKQLHVSAVCPGPIQSEFFETAKFDAASNSFVAKMLKKAPSSESLATYIIRQVIHKKRVVVIYPHVFKLLVWVQRLMPLSLIRILTGHAQALRLDRSRKINKDQG